MILAEYDINNNQAEQISVNNSPLILAFSVLVLNFSIRLLLKRKQKFA